MASAGGALRVISLGTWRLSSIVNTALGKLIPAGSPLAKWYRVEKTREPHCNIPRRFGWQLLAGSGTDIKGLLAASATSRELEMTGLELEDAPTGHTITSPGFRPGGGNCSATERRIKPIVEPAQSDVTTVAVKHRHDKHKKILLERKAYQAYAKLKAAAEADGVSANTLTVVSGYRSISHQKVLFQRAVEKYGSEKAATKWVAPPGHSAHHTGRAIDFYIGGSNSSTNAAKQRTLAPYKWLVCNALRFGFTPYAAEPWHWEFHPAPRTT
jgi:D-alanyl-D-alanine dipeptidase